MEFKVLIVLKIISFQRLVLITKKNQQTNFIGTICGTVLLFHVTALHGCMHAIVDAVILLLLPVALHDFRMLLSFYYLMFVFLNL